MYIGLRRVEVGTARAKEAYTWSRDGRAWDGPQCLYYELRPRWLYHGLERKGISRSEMAIS